MARLNLNVKEIFDIDCAANFTSATLGDLGYECAEEFVSNVGVNILLDCIKVEILGSYGVMYSCYYNKIFKDIHYRQIIDNNDCLVTVISMLEVNDNFKKLVEQLSISYVQIKSKLLIVLYEDDLKRLSTLIKPISVFIPKASGPVLFSRIMYEDVYLLRFKNRCDMNTLIVPENWSLQRKGSFYESIQYLQEMNKKITGWR